MHLYPQVCQQHYDNLNLTLTDRAPIPTLIDWGGVILTPPSISASVTDKDVKFFSGGSCVFLEKITFSSHSGQAAP